MINPYRMQACTMTHLGRLFGILGIVAVVAALASCNRTTPPPNVLLIVADDLGYNDLAINNGNPDRHTPTLDQLAREGVRFTRHYADAVCSPARAALLTGMSAARIGYTPNGRGMSPELVTIAEALAEHGYETVHIGKWHIGHLLREAWPDRQGFAHWFGFLSQWLLPGEHVNGELVPGEPRYEDPWLMRDGDAGARYTGNLDAILSDEAVKQIKEPGRSGKPWFVNLWYYSPHAPLTPEGRFATQEADTPQGRYKAMVRQFDANVAHVLQALEDSGQKESTLIVLVSDNGAITKPLDDTNQPFFGAKASYWEGGLRTPMLIRWPGAESAGTVRDDVVAIQDIYPTILGRLGIPAPPGLDGQDIGHAPAPGRDLLWEFWSAGHLDYSILHDGRMRAYKTWPYTPWETPAFLFDVDRNPGAPENIVATEPELLAKIEDRRRRIQRSLHRPTLVFSRESDGTGRLEGLGFLRTPGFGGFSFGIGIGQGYAGRAAAQDGIWSMDVATDGRITVDLQGHRLQAQLPPGGCRAVILSGWFSRRLNNWIGADDRMTLSLLIDGERVAALDELAALDDTRFASPTITGTPGAATNNALLSDPVLLIEPVETSDSLTPAELGRELCP